MTASSLPLVPLGDAEGERVACAHADRCGGCPVIASTYVVQLVRKGARVAQALARYAALGGLVPRPIVPAEPIVGYRTRAKLVVGSRGEIGLYAKGGGHNVVDVPGCRVITPAIAAVAEAIRAQIASERTRGGVLAPSGSSGRGRLRAVDLREVRDDGAAGVLVTFIVDRDAAGRRSRRDATDAAAFAPAAEWLMNAAPAVVGVAVNFHGGEGPQILGNRTVLIAGAACASDRVGRSVHLATFGSFVQAHRGQAEKLHALIVDTVVPSPEGLPRQPGPRVLDLYGGSGSIALALAAAGATVHMVESFPPAVSYAQQAARAQKLDVQAVCADVSDALRAVSNAHERFDAAVLNPPRRGASSVAREWLARLAPRLIVYVACDPDTLARDLDHLARLGYSAEALQPLDMIPLTEEVETVAVLRRTGVPAARVLFEDDEVLIVEKGPHEPTTPQGEYQGSLLARVRRISGAEGAVPVHRLDVGTGGLVVFARRPEHVAPWARVLADPTTTKSYVAAVRGITPPEGTVRRRLREGRRAYDACTRYKRIACASRHSLLGVVPDQGRTHQIRRHLAAVGHPVLGDERYGDAATNRHFAEKYGLDRTFLHCVVLDFEHPRTRARQRVESPPGGDLRAVLERLGGSDALRALDEHRRTRVR